MDKKTAHYFATLAAKETFNKTLKKLAQEYVERDSSGRPVHVRTETEEGTPYDPSKNTGGEVKYERIDDREVNRPSGDLGGFMPSNSRSFEVGKADDKDDEDDKCPKCGCDCKSKKEASANSSLMKVAAMYAKASK